MRTYSTSRYTFSNQDNRIPATPWILKVRPQPEQQPRPQAYDEKFRLLPFFSTALLGLIAVGAPVSPVQSTGPSSSPLLASAPLRSSQFNAVTCDAGHLYSLLDQKDGVRLLKTDATATVVLAQAQLGTAVGVAVARDRSGDL